MTMVDGPVFRGVRLGCGALALLLSVAGCEAPPARPSGTAQASKAASVPARVPFVDTYCTAEDPRFAERPSPDPLGRKFRVAFLQLSIVERDPKEADAKRVQDMSGGQMRTWMCFRQQAEDSPSARNLKASEDLAKSFQNYMKSSRSYRELRMDGMRFADPVVQRFVKARNDGEALSGELSQRYPNLFSADSGAFPLDVIVLMARSPDPASMATCFEAWLVGLPEHADLADARKPWGIFQADRGYPSPWDAIAAALFKLSDAQFKGLEPANPLDHAWLEEE